MLCQTTKNLIIYPTNNINNLVVQKALPMILLRINKYEIK